MKLKNLKRVIKNVTKKHNVKIVVEYENHLVKVVFNKKIVWYYLISDLPVTLRSRTNHVLTNFFNLNEKNIMNDDVFNNFVDALRDLLDELGQGGGGDGGGGEDLDVDELRAELDDVYKEYKTETDLKSAKALLEPFDAKTTKTVDDADLVAAIASFKDALDGGEGEEEDVTVEKVRVALQAFYDENAKACKKIIKDFQLGTITSKRGITAKLLKDLDDDELKDLYVEATDA